MREHRIALKICKALIIWFSIKYYIITFVYGYPFCKEYNCLMHEIKLKDKDILYKFMYSMCMSLMHGVIETSTWFIVPYCKIGLLIYLFS
uniref:Uncharacterized protein n=1 Tax=viral metagenome TaxID=1070528 RepID=A0A6C0JDS5_9ZZZZ